MADATALQYLALGVLGWLLLAVIWLNVQYRTARKSMTDAEKLAEDHEGAADRTTW